MPRQDEHNKQSKKTEDALALFRTLVDLGVPHKPVVSLPRPPIMEANTGLKRLNKKLPFSDSPLAQSNIVDALLGTGALESLSDPSNIGGIGPSAAGLPFSAYKAKGLKSIYHGTQKRFDKFDPSKYDKDDVLGWLTHFAEDPKYAGSYALGGTKHQGIDKSDKWSDIFLPNYWDDKIGDYINVRPRTIIAEPEAKNVLDLVDPHPDDISQALAFADPYHRKEVINVFKTARRFPSQLKMNLKSTHYPDKDIIPDKEIPVRSAASRLRLTPEATEKMPFDAIRYHDMSEKSWAIPERTPIRSSFGAPLNEAAEEEIVSPIKMVRFDDLSTGNLPVKATDPNLENDIAKQVAYWLNKGIPVDNMLNNIEHGGQNLGKFTHTPGAQEIAKKILMKEKVKNLTLKSEATYVPKSSKQLNEEYAKSSLKPAKKPDLTNEYYDLNTGKWINPSPHKSFPVGSGKLDEIKQKLFTGYNKYEIDVSDAAYQLFKDGKINEAQLNKIEYWIEDGMPMASGLKEIKLPPKPKTHIIENVIGKWDQNTNTYEPNLFKIGIKKFPYTEMGKALAKKEIHNMVKNSVINDKEAANIFKALAKLKVAKN